MTDCQKDINSFQIPSSSLEKKYLIFKLEQKAKLLVENLKSVNSKDAEEEMTSILDQLLQHSSAIRKLDCFTGFLYVALDHFGHKTRDAEKVLRIYKYVKKIGLVDLDMLGAVYAALTETSLNKEANQVFDNHFSSSLSPITLKRSQAVAGYSRAITGVLNAKKIDDAWKLYNSMRMRTLKPNAFILHSFLVYFIKRKDPINGMKCYSQLVRDGAAVNPFVYSVLLELSIDNPSLNDAFWKEYCEQYHSGQLPGICKENGISEGKVDSVVMSVIRHRFVSLIKRRYYEEAQVIFQSIPIHRKSVYVALALEFKHNDDSAMATQTFSLMTSAGYPHCAKTRGILMNIWRNAHRYGKFEKQASAYLREFRAREKKALAESSFRIKDSSFRKFLESEVPTWKTMLIGYVGWKKWKKAARLFAHFTKMGYSNLVLKRIKSLVNEKYRQQTRRKV